MPQDALTADCTASTAHVSLLVDRSHMHSKTAVLLLLLLLVEWGPVGFLHYPIAVLLVHTVTVRHTVKVNCRPQHIVLFHSKVTSTQCALTNSQFHSKVASTQCAITNSHTCCSPAWWCGKRSLIRIVALIRWQQVTKIDACRNSRCDVLIQRSGVDDSLDLWLDLGRVVCELEQEA